ncbi:CD276 antigen-like isoform X1 [Heterodontus francisci]|uniref:CD276 antigen-like isoform X1 n=1 Tax=Heterodontus francisci TaxID=7792 RepID=UPI00355B9F28
MGFCLTCDQTITDFHVNNLQLTTSAEFKVDTPEAPVTAIHGQYTVLRCSFTVQDESSLERLVISWQHVETEEVVYSYYYGKEQLSRQSPQYSGRTSLFPEQLKQENASLKLDQVRPENTAQYQCFVRTTKGNNKGFMFSICRISLRGCFNILKVLPF